MLSIALFICILAIGGASYLLGHRDGYAKGRDSGFVRGHQHGQKAWIRAMEQRRGPDGHDQLVRAWTDLTTRG